MLKNLILEILILWACYAVYMELLVRRRGPVGGLFFYPKVVQTRTFELGLISQEEYKRRKIIAYVSLLAWLILVPLFMIVYVNGARSYFDCCWQYYVLFLGAEFYDWLFIDTIWVAISDWWIIPGTEDLLDTWHGVKIKAWKMPKLLIFSLPIAALIGGLCWLVGRLVG